MKKKYLGTIILFCSLLSGCGGGGNGSSSKTHTNTSVTTESTSVNSTTTSSVAVSGGKNTSETLYSTPTVTTEATETTGATEISSGSENIPSAPEITDLPAPEKKQSDPVYHEGTVLTRTVDDVDSRFIYKRSIKSSNDAYTLSLKGDEVDLAIEPLNTGDPLDHRSLASKNLNILRDKEGRPVGFFGMVETYTWETERDRSGKVRYGRTDYIVAMNGEDKRQPSVAGNYSGRLFYDHNQAPGKEADISLRYEDSKVTGTIIDRERPEFSLKIDAREPHDVEKDGSFLAALVGNKNPTDKEMHGYIDGGFYGKDGEIVAGYVRSRDDDSWGGVFGGERQD
ncbi:transferrin-binding protein-like solute binding protein [Salmonella enterica]|nr:transferrin-binding protein-like solute binding protein [Salmonella enterica]